MLPAAKQGVMGHPLQTFQDEPRKQPQAPVFWTLSHLLQAHNEQPLESACRFHYAGARCCTR